MKKKLSVVTIVAAIDALSNSEYRTLLPSLNRIRLERNSAMIREFYCGQKVEFTDSGITRQGVVFTLGKKKVGVLVGRADATVTWRVPPAMLRPVK